MNQSIRELAALGRIIRVIKCFHRLAPDAKLVSKGTKEAYLKQHLSRQDWKLWEQLQAEFQEMPINQTDTVPEKGLTPMQFRRLLGQYKRAGLESYQVGCQTQRHTDFGLGDTLSSC